MHHPRWRIAAALPIVAALIAPIAMGTSTTSGFAYTHMSKLQKRIISGRASAFFDPATDPATSGNAPRRAARVASPLGPVSSGGNYDPSSASGCSLTIGSNVKVNQNCLNLTDPDLQGRAQANNETSIAQDPSDPSHILGSFNDYRRGDGNCYGAYSLNHGSTWTDTTIPMGFTRGKAFGAQREYWTSGGDTAVAFDTKGNAYFQCQVFNRGNVRAVTNNPDDSSAIYVFRSTHNAGASWNFPGRSVVERSDATGACGNCLEDKPLMTVDANVGSPFQDRIYVTYTEFLADGTAKIWSTYSKDYGETFSTRVLVSSTSTLCPNPVGTAPNSCDANQFSDPFVGKDGNLYVAYVNYNNSVTGPKDNHNQVLLSKSTDGGSTFAAPVLVANYYDVPDCATYQAGKSLGRACVPEKGAGHNSYFRVANYPSGAVDPKNSNKVVVSFGSYISKYSKETTGCTPDGFDAATGNNLYVGTKVVCNNKILLSVSTNGGGTFNGTTTNTRALNTANQAPAQKTTSQWFQWAAYTPGGKFVTSYYDRAYGNDETTGFMDISLSAGSNPLNGVFTSARVTSSQMPPPTQFGGTFFGDYTGLSVLGGKAHPLWSDTRSADLFLCPGTGTPSTPPEVCEESADNASVANNQEAMTASVVIP